MICYRKSKRTLCAHSHAHSQLSQEGPHFCGMVFAGGEGNRQRKCLCGTSVCGESGPVDLLVPGGGGKLGDVDSISFFFAFVLLLLGLIIRNDGQIIVTARKRSTKLAFIWPLLGVGSSCWRAFKHEPKSIIGKNGQKIQNGSVFFTNIPKLFIIYFNNRK